MRSPALKRIRVILAIVVLLAVTTVFIDFRDLVPDSYYNSILYLQFVPSVIKFITLPVLAAAGFLFIILLTVLTGRTYCSVICPLGILQDGVSRFGGMFRKKNRRFGYGKPFTIIRYGLLAITLIVTLTGGLYLVTHLDPYSIYGRFSTYFLKPVVLLVNNLVAGIVNKYDIYSVYRVDIKGVTALAYIIPSAFLFLVVAFSFRKGRLYCNTVCPVGTLLGLVSKVSLLRIKIDKSDCSKCGRCAIACKASCIDFLSKSVDMSRCVGCFNCLTTCPDRAISYGQANLRKRSIIRKRSIKGVQDPDPGKRDFISAVLLLLFGSSQVLKGMDYQGQNRSGNRGGNRNGQGRGRGQGQGQGQGQGMTMVREEKTSPVCMPGATSIDNFLARCTACSLCVSACPKNVIHPSLMEYGLAGIMQPRMDYHKGFCNFDCVKCTEICPTGALMPLDLEAKKLTQIGVAIFIKKNCIVHTDKTDCGACSEHCPTKAVQMVPYEGTLVIPEVTIETCIGCGACEYACPTVPYKAIFIDGNRQHIAAEKPESEKATLKMEDFPF